MRSVIDIGAGFACACALAAVTAFGGAVVSDADDSPGPGPVVATTPTGPEQAASDPAPTAGTGAAVTPQRAEPGAIPTRSAAGWPTARSVNPPVRLVVDALRADLAVDAVGIDGNGDMELPPDAARAGWYRFGPTPGADAGATVIAAHSGSQATPRGPLRHLGDLSPGESIDITRADGTTLRYVVESAHLAPKTTIDLTEHFRREGEHRLVLITCAGTWAEDQRSYSDNAVVTAMLVES